MQFSSFVDKEIWIVCDETTGKCTVFDSIDVKKDLNNEFIIANRSYIII